MDSGDVEVVRQAIVAAAKFVEDYHTSLLKKDSPLIDILRNHTVFVWNGQKIVGGEAIAKTLGEFPSCSIWQSTIDVQVLDSLFLV